MADDFSALLKVTAYFTFVDYEKRENLPLNSDKINVCENVRACSLLLLTSELH